MKAAIDLRDTLNVRAKNVLLEYMSNRRDNYKIITKFQNFMYKIVPPLQRKMIWGIRLRKFIPAYIKERIAEQISELTNKNSKKKKASKKSNDKDLKNLKALLKDREKEGNQNPTIDNLVKMINHIFIQRHKIKMIYFEANKEEHRERNDDEEYKQEEDELTPEELQAKIERKERLMRLAKARTEEL